MERFKGVFAVIATAFTDEEELDVDALRKHVEYLIDVGHVHGIITLGSNGEAASLTEAERGIVMNAVIDTVNHRVPCLVGASANATRDSIRYAKAAEKAGADGLMIVHPFYCRPNPEELYGHYIAIDKSVGIPIMIYNNPFTSGVDMLPDLFARIVANTKNVRYLKESSGDEARLGQVIQLLGDEVSVFNGWDNIILEQFLLGAKGWVAGSANVLPRECVELYNLAVVQEDFVAARKLYKQLYRFFTMVETSGKFIQYSKFGCKEEGHPVGPPRRPLLMPTDPNEVAALRDALKQAKQALVPA